MVCGLRPVAGATITHILGRIDKEGIGAPASPAVAVLIHDVVPVCDNGGFTLIGELL